MVADFDFPPVVEASKVEHKSFEIGRIHLGGIRLCVCSVGSAPHTDLTVRVRQSPNPIDCVVPVAGGDVVVLTERSFRFICPADVLQNHDIALTDEVLGTINEPLAFLAIWGPLQQDRKLVFYRFTVQGWTIDVGCKVDTVPHGNHDVFVK